MRTTLAGHPPGLRPLRCLLAGTLLGTIVALGSAAAAADPAPLVFVDTNSAVQPPARIFAGAATTADGAVLLVGGGLPDDAPPADTWTYTAAGGWQARCGTSGPATPACPLGPRITPGAGGATGGVVLYGGFVDGLGDGTNAQDDAWQWDGAAWQPLCDGCPPGGRGLHAMAGNGTTVVLYGGNGPDGPRDDTWVYDGSTWTNPCGGASGVPCGPSALMGAAMAWDGTRFVMFGGAQPVPGEPEPTDDTWAFDGTTWTQVCGTSRGGAACGPEARVLAAASSVPSSDPARRGALLVQGGNIFGGNEQRLLRDAWLWRAGAWTQVAVPWDGPPVVWSDEDGPAPGDWPLLGAAAALPEQCEIVYAAAGVGPTGLFPATYLGGPPGSDPVVPQACDVVPVTTTTTTTAVPAPTAAGTGSVARIARTGPAGTGRAAALGAALLVAGGACVLGARRRRAAPSSAAD